MPDPNPPQNDQQPTRDPASNGSRPPTPEPSKRRKKSRRDLERGFEEALLQQLKAGGSRREGETELVVSQYERITRLGIEVRTSWMLMLALLVVLAIELTLLFVSPLFFSVNLLIACVGLLAKQRRRSRPEAPPEEEQADP